MATVLLVDDNLKLVKFLARHLQYLLPDLEVVTAASARDAVEQMIVERPELVVLDWSLPDGLGLTLMEELRRIAPSVAGIIISGSEVDLSSGELDWLGVRAVLRKPFDAEQLAEVIRQHFPGPKRVAPEPSVARSPFPFFDRHAMANRLSSLTTGLEAFAQDLRAVAEDPAAIRRTVDEYLDVLQDTVRQINSAIVGKGM